MPNNRRPEPQIDRYAALYAGIIAAGFTLHIAGNSLRIEPAAQGDTRAGSARQTA